MRWRKQLKSETSFLKKVVCFKYGRTVSAKTIKLHYQTKTSETVKKKKGNIEKEKRGPREKSATTSAKEKVAG